MNGSAVSSGNTHFVSGAQVAAETRVGAKGNYILSENSAAANLQALDKGLGSVADAVGDKVNKSEVKDLVKVTNGSHTQVTSDDTPDGGVNTRSTSSPTAWLRTAMRGSLQAAPSKRPSPTTSRLPLTSRLIRVMLMLFVMKPAKP